jgi:cell wall-associated NlpC family hydrolase
MDCSGLTQISGHLCGLTVPRDASQQWKALQRRQKQQSQLETGDLVYFHKVGGTSISHVGLALMDEGTSQVLHASGEVRVDDLGPEGIIRDGDLTHAWSGATAWPVISE